MFKTCYRCKQKKHSDLFVKGNRLNNEECKECKRARNRIYRIENPDKVKACRNKYAKSETFKKTQHKYRVSDKGKKTALRCYYKNKAKWIVRSKKWASNNPEKVKEIKKRKRRKMVDEVSNSYIKELLKQQGWDKGHITGDIIQLKKAIIKTKRLCKNNQATSRS